jgi:hypothetical protein
MPYRCLNDARIRKVERLMVSTREQAYRLVRRIRRWGMPALLALGMTGRAGAAADVAKAYQETIEREPGLMAYWTLDGSVRATQGALELRSTQETPATREGPLGGVALDLSDGNELVLQPHALLDAPALSIELMFQIVNARSGNTGLFGVRGPGGTRFSLHFNAGSRALLVWNGGRVSQFRSNDEMKVGEWFHLVMNLKDGVPSLWLNGKACKPGGEVSPVGAAKGLPFVLGNSMPGGTAEKADIAVAHLAMYDRPLTPDQAVRHVNAAGWSRKLREQLVWQDLPVSLLEAQIGYHPRNIKRVYLRSAQEHPPEEFLAKEFTVMEAATGKEVFRGTIERWGAKWESFWWVLDFTPVRAPGEYYVQAGRLVSSPFDIQDGIFHKTDLDVIALDQLEHRIHHGLEDARRGLAGRYMNAADDVRIYMDCGSPYSELQPVGTCVYALMDLHELLGDRFSEADRKRMLDLAILGADYFVAAQRHTDDPETDGMFHHSLLVNTNDTWAGEIFTYLDTAYGAALLAKSHQFFKDRDPERAARYLAAAKKAWTLCAHRPYHTKADRTFPRGVNAFFWNAPHGIQDTFGRCLYNILDKDWTMPDDLRTRDRLPFVQASARLYEITGEQVYLDKAIEFADAIIERQFTDWEHPIEGTFGYFYEFPGNDEVFFHEFMQGGFWWQGNVEALNLEGFMHLLRLAPDHPKAAAWQNTLRTYAEHYAAPATTVNPLGIYPVACYRDPEHGGLKNFQQMLMGSSCLYGFSAKNFMKLADFLQDARYQTHAIAGVNFIAGLNPGVPNAYKDTAWDARTLIAGVGRSWFGPAGEPADTARGSVPNGFCASSQFWHLTGYVNFLSDQPDKPAGLVGPGGGLQFNEGWILHSHAYVQAVARMEAPYTLNLRALNAGTPVPATAVITLRESAAPHGEHTVTLEIGADGVRTVTDLPTPAQGTVRLTHGGRTIERPVAAVSAGRHGIEVDFAREVTMAIETPELLDAGAPGVARMRVRNTGTAEVTVSFALSASGVTLERTGWTVTLKPRETKTRPLAFTCGTKVMPYMIRAYLQEGAPPRAFEATGKIKSADPANN